MNNNDISKKNDQENLEIKTINISQIDSSTPPSFPIPTPEEIPIEKEQSNLPNTETPLIISTKDKPKKKNYKKSIGIILGILVIFSGIGTGLILLKQRQDIREKASNLEVDQQDIRENVENPSPLAVNLDRSAVINAQCLQIKAYSTNWTSLSVNDLKNLKAGDKVRFTVKGKATSGNFSKARFTINSATKPETSQKKPNTDEFYIEYVIPNNIVNFTINAKVYHSTLGWI